MKGKRFLPLHGLGYAPKASASLALPTGEPIRLGALAECGTGSARLGAIW